ncbi:AKAP7-like phosphoesterase domain-containing protein [Gelidibacter pelagius]|uniref:Mutarotase n=1 Tax=Gelidibacter pelagius TaxID=2819985 RepID=A0ABS3SQF0_9FLAO|nr:mutarotase [Gelidibacter pelagius]MBO3097937.1 mutarotase [Gelidibacter pelagius]
MNLTEHYNKLYKESIGEISSDNYEIDPMLHAENDQRFGMSLLIKPPMAVKNEIQKFLEELKSIEPDQYYYPNSDIHITVISVVSCYDGLKLSNLNVPEYIELIEKSLENAQHMTINCKGITASPSCIMIQGFIEGNGLNEIRDNLRRNFKDSNLEQSIDERYLIQTAHATVFRFSEQLKEKEEFLALVDKYRNHDFGTFKVNTMELSYNDWYHREGLVTKLHEFKMANTDVKTQRA